MPREYTSPQICIQLYWVCALWSNLDWFWTDAICINQGDNVDRGRQVPLMRKIYQAATQTIVYLGEARDNCEEFLEAAEDFAKAIISQKQWKAAGNEAEIC